MKRKPNKQSGKSVTTLAAPSGVQSENVTLTPRLLSVLDYLALYTQQHRCSPTLIEIANHLGLSSVSNIHRHLDRLEAGGYLTTDPTRRRSVQLTALGARIANPEEAA